MHDPAATLRRLRQLHAEIKAIGAHGIARELVRDIFVRTGRSIADADRVVDDVLRQAGYPKLPTIPKRPLPRCLRIQSFLKD